MTNINLVGPWTGEIATEVESLLTMIMGRHSEVLQPMPASIEKYGDYKIEFTYLGTPTGESFFLAYDPNGQVLRLWTAGVSYRVPEELWEIVDGLFVEDFYSQEASLGTDPIHVWSPVTPDMIEQLAKQ